MRKQLSKGRKLQGTRSLAKLAKTINARVRSEKKAAAALETTTEQRVPGPSKPKQTMPYSAHDRILLVGEANFSFMHALLVLFQDTPDEERGGLVGTSLDALDTLTEKYGEDCLEHIALCREAGYHVYHKVDAANLSAYKFLRNQRFSKIVFNFPHTGSGIKDKRLNILKQQALIQAFLESASSLLDPSHGEIHITTKTGDPYDLYFHHSSSFSSRFFYINLDGTLKRLLKSWGSSARPASSFSQSCIPATNIGVPSDGKRASLPMIIPKS